MTSTSVSLAWQPAPGPAQNPIYSPIVSYTIMERKTSPVSNIPTVTGIAGTNSTVTGLTPGSSHIWFVSGVDAEGTASALTYVYVVVTNPIPVAASLGSASFAADGSFQFSVTEGGSVLQTVLIQATTNPADPNSWQQIGSLLPTTNPFIFTDSNAAQYPARFFRIVAQYESQAGANYHGRARCPHRAASVQGFDNLARANHFGHFQSFEARRGHRAYLI